MYITFVFFAFIQMKNALFRTICQCNYGYVCVFGTCFLLKNHCTIFNLVALSYETLAKNFFQLNRSKVLISY